MYNNKETNNGSNKRTTEKGSLPGFLGNEGKSKEVSRVFTSILAGGCNTRDEGQRTIQARGLYDSIEVLAKRENIWYENFENVAFQKIGSRHENTVYLSKDGKNVIKFNNLIYAYDSESLIKFIERINSHNEFSTEAPYTVHGFAKNKEGRIGLVMSQPYIKGAMEADSYTIESYLKKQGFRYENLSVENKKGWTNGT